MFPMIDIPWLLLGPLFASAMQENSVYAARITPQDEVSLTPAVADYDLPIAGHSFELEITEEGPHVFSASSPHVDTYLILRTVEGVLLAEDDDGWFGSNSRIETSLGPGQFVVTVCSVRALEGDVELHVEPGAPASWEPGEQATLALESAQLGLELVVNEFGRGGLHHALALERLGRAQRDMGEYQASLRSFDECLRFRRQQLGDHHVDVGLTVDRLATAFWQRANYSKARVLYEEALQILEQAKGPDHPWVGTVHNNLGLLLYFEGKYSTAEHHYEAALSVFREPEDVAMTLTNLAFLRSKVGENEAALSLFEESVELNDLAELPLQSAYALVGMGSTLDQLGRAGEALAARERALKLRLKCLPHDHLLVGVSKIAVGSSFLQMGRTVEARSFLEEGLQAQKKSYGDRHPQVGKTTRVLGTTLCRLGYREEGVAMLRKAVEILHENGSDLDWAVAAADLAVMLVRQGAYSEAVQLTRQALAVYEAKAPRGFGVVAETYNLARALWWNGDRSEAVNEIGLAVARGLETLAPGHPLVGRALHQHAWMLHQEGDLYSARPLYERAISIKAGSLGPGHPSTSKSMAQLCMLLVEMGEREQARDLGSEAVHGVREHLHSMSPYLPEEDRWRVVADYRWILELHLATADSLEECYQDVLGWKGQVSRTLPRGRAFAGHPSARRSADELRALVRQIESAREESTDREQLAALEQRYRELEQRLSASLGLDEPPRPAVSQVSSALAKDTVAVDFLVHRRLEQTEDGRLEWSPSHLTAWVLHPGERVRAMDLGPVGPIEAAIVDHVEAIAGAGRASRVAAGGALRALVWDPIASLISDAKWVLISPDGALGWLPFGTLPDGPEGSDYLLERHGFVRVADLGQLAESRQAVTPLEERRLVALGDVDFETAGVSGDGQALVHADRVDRSRLNRAWGPLPHSRAELRRVTALAEQTAPATKIQTLRRGDATRERFVSALPGATHVHLATHGAYAPEPRTVDLDFVQSGNPVAADSLPALSAYLVFAGANREPGESLLTAEEISWLDLTACKLAVLSACDTALGDVRLGEGMASLQAALHVAGARNVVGSLWKVDDEATYELMAAFYRRLWEHGDSIREALRGAQLELLEHNEQTERDALPGTWGAFVLSGPGA